MALEPEPCRTARSGSPPGSSSQPGAAAETLRRAWACDPVEGRTPGRRKFRMLGPTPRVRHSVPQDQLPSRYAVGPGVPQAAPLDAVPYLPPAGTKLVVENAAAEAAALLSSPLDDDGDVLSGRQSSSRTKVPVTSRPSATLCSWRAPYVFRTLMWDMRCLGVAAADRYARWHAVDTVGICPVRAGITQPLRRATAARGTHHPRIAGRWRARAARPA